MIIKKQLELLNPPQPTYIMQKEDRIVTQPTHEHTSWKQEQVTEKWLRS